MQAGEGQLGLGLNPGARQDLESRHRGMGFGGFEQRGLSNSRRAAKQQRSATCTARGIDAFGERYYLAVATDQRRVCVYTTHRTARPPEHFI
jgi:hypothetical protein